MTAASTTRVIVLTPPGRGAVAVVRIEGNAAIQAVDSALFRQDGGRIADVSIGRIVVGHWGSASGEEVVVCRRSADAVEVHCHGGAAAVEAIVARLAEFGCIPIPWRESRLVQSSDPIRAAAYSALADASTERTAAILLDQFDGALCRQLQEILTSAVAGNWGAAIAMLDAVLAHARLGQHLTRAWRVVIAGRPNVGKSSLLNALLGYERAIVFDMPGTTRDVVTANTAIDGWPVLLADTAGLRATTDAIESAGVQRATTAAADADLVIWLDDTVMRVEPDLPAGVHVLRVLNKTDLHPNLSDADRQVYDACVSARHGDAIEGLIQLIGQALVPAPPELGEAVPFTADQIAALDAARAAAASRDLPAAERCLQPFLG